MAVSVSAGTDAIISAFPALHSHNVLMAVIFVILLTVLNLRGVTESASILAYPVYLFVLTLLILIGVGLFNSSLGSGKVFLVQNGWRFLISYRRGQNQWKHYRKQLLCLWRMYHSIYKPLLIPDW